ncbi:MAG: hypothetical protein J7L32_02675 [Thermoplasmata archaeon]|nr:MAG: hypothetical protein FE035_00305 [Thermoplasmata archaeon]MCD6468200.1 hypothetical protein [Thermoplasmata archaeon]RLF23772.1 MAG: hypothetical protein DRN01_07285 [Thermoplasmata archaeon]
MKKSRELNQNQINSDYEWLLMQNLSKYSGEWIAVLERRIVARDISLKKTMDKVKSLGLKTMPLFLRVPEGSITT